MAKIHTIEDINIRALVDGETQVISIPKGSLIEVTEQMAVYFCNEDIEALTVSEQKLHRRVQKAERTGFFTSDNLLKTHEDYTFL